MKSEALALISAWTAGTALGAVFFGGLWWTVIRSVSAKRPAVLFLGSLMARMGITLSGFYLVSGHHWERLLACLLGFIMARMAVNRAVRAPAMGRSRLAPGAGDAP